MYATKALVKMWLRSMYKRAPQHDWTIRGRLRQQVRQDLHWVQNNAYCRRCRFEIPVASLHVLGHTDALGLHPVQEIPWSCAETLIGEIHDG